MLSINIKLAIGYFRDKLWVSSRQNNVGVGLLNWFNFNYKIVKQNYFITHLFFSIRCQSPAQLRGKLVHDIPSDELICENPDDPGRLFITLFWICLVLALFGLFVSGIVYLSRNCLGQWAMKIRHRGADTVRYDNVVNENDLVRILPNHENYEPMEIWYIQFFFFFISWMWEDVIVF